IGHDRAVQGNLDPAILFAPEAVIREQVADVMRRAEGRPGHIFNVGHGIMPGTPLESVDIVLDAVRSYRQP
ncbi:MAG: uroporphyrinogen decarboxylase, partial [Proteobacteria bacterium]|nr:uroporphyrinogen decarboxylase [Pseudomonadota bacterium]